MAQCTAKSKQSGERCKKDAVPGYNVCHMHGGKTPRGIASANFKHGKHSKVLPARLAARYQEALVDERLLELREDLALVDSRISDLLTRVDTNESGALWRRTQAAYYDLVESFGTADSKLIQGSMNKLRTCIQQGNDDYLAWDEVSKALEQRRRLVESERKRLVEAQQMISSEQLMVLLSAILSTLRTHITDRRTLANISAELQKLLVVNNNVIDITAEQSTS